MKRQKYPYGDMFLKNRFELRGDQAVIFVGYRGEALECKVDIADLDVIAASGICFGAIYNRSSKTFYAGGYPPGSQRASSGYTFLHRMLTKAPAGMVVDHWDHDGLNDRRSNLRIVSNGENLLNRRGATKASLSGLRGVYLRKDTGKWSASIKVAGKPHALGCFDTSDQASAAVLSALKTRSFPSRQVGTVYFDKVRKKWSAQHRCDGKKKSLGRFDSREAAEKALERSANGTVS